MTSMVVAFGSIGCIRPNGDIILMPYIFCRWHHPSVDSLTVSTRSNPQESHRLAVWSSKPKHKRKLHTTSQIPENPLYYFPMLLTCIFHIPSHNSHCMCHIWSYTHHEIHQASNRWWIGNPGHAIYLFLCLWILILAHDLGTRNQNHQRIITKYSWIGKKLEPELFPLCIFNKK